MRFVPFALTLTLFFAGRLHAEAAAEMKPYTDSIPGVDVKFEMVPIPGGTFLMGSPDTEPGRGKDEGPQHLVEIKPMWVGKYEVTWDEFDIFSTQIDITKRKQMKVEKISVDDKAADAVSRPTPPYTDMTFGKGRQSYPATCMTHHAAMVYTQWLSAKTGKNYRLMTEAEWEYACRAGTTTAYSFGDDPKALDDYAWFADNSKKSYHPVGQKKPNAFGLYDMHGNASEWVLDHYKKDFYAQFPKDKATLNPVLLPTDKEYPYVSKGGSWKDKAPGLRSAVRLGSDEDYSIQDPQLPQSIWWHTDASNVGFRICRPLEEQDNLKGFKSPIKSENGR